MTNTVRAEFDELESMVDGTIESSEFVGDMMEENPNQNTTRIYIQNLNGLCWNKEGGRWPYVCEVVSSIQADVACFSEINTDTNRYEVRTKMEQICQRHFDQNSLVMASSSIRTSNTYKPGGTAILTCNGMTTRVQKHTRDRLGRWASICLQTTPTKRLRIISAYQVCQTSRPGTFTAASQQAAQLILERSTSTQPNFHNPRQSFIHDLQSFIKQVQQNGEDIILAGDFNEDITAPNSGMNEISTTCCLIDLFSIRLGTTSIPSTYQRGSRRLDYILISPSLLSSVQAAGYDPFGYRLPSDHRGMFIDLSTTMIFEQSAPALPAATKRDFQTSSPEVIQKYVNAKTKYLQDHNFFERLSVLNTLQTPNPDLAESLDRDLERASHHAARVCTQKSKPPWSPQLAKAWAELHYYRLLVSANQSTVNYDPAIQRLRTQWPDLPDSHALDPNEIATRQKQALSTLKQTRLEAHKLREEFLKKRYAQSLAEDDTRTARIVQRIIRAENQHRIYNKLRSLRNREQGNTRLSCLKVPKHHSVYDAESMKRIPDNNDHWETITVPHLIEQLLIQRNQHHFGQADGTPFTRGPLLADVGYKADGYAAELILGGQIQYRNTTRATKLLIKHLQKRTMHTLDGSISYDETLQKLKNWPESTTTSPSGLHLGHYHCSWKDPRMDVSDPTRETFILHQKQLLQATVSMLNYAIKFGHTYERWTKIVNIMLEKDAGNPRIHRLRVIHIYEADYNLLLAVKWRQALHHAEDHNLLNDGLYGSRPGRSAQDPALLEVLQNEIYRMSMKPGINYDLDATSCYDRILANISVLSSRRVGISPQVAYLNALTLEKSRYHLKTHVGVSTRCYSHTAEHPIHGTGQGSGNSPTIWCFVCSTLFDALSEAAHGATFHDYTRRITSKVYITGFVDDCTQRANLFSSTRTVESSELVTLMEQDAQLWNDLLWSSGGELEQSKCSYHLIASDWNSNGHPFLKGGKSYPIIHITHDGRRIPTQQKSNYDAHKTLGCYINPAYNRTQAWKAISNKNESFSMLIDTNFLSRPEAWTFYTSTYLPSVTYSLPITPLTRIQCQQLDSRFLRSLLPTCGYNRNMSRAIRYAPFRVGGAGFKDLYLEQGALILQQITKYFNSPDTTIGKLLLMAASWTQAFIGTSTFFLEAPHQPIPPVNPSLLLDLRTFLNHIQGTIRLRNPPTPALLRENDRCIMDIVMEQTCWTPLHIMQINSCRRYLQAQTLADLTTLSGTRLQQQVHNGCPATPITTLRVSAFNQPRPHAKAWRTWRRFLSTISNSYGVLVTSLGKWKGDVTTVRHWPTYLYDPSTDTFLSHSEGPHYHEHYRMRPGCFSLRPESSNPQQGRGYPTATRIIMDTLRPECNFLPVDPQILHDFRVGPCHHFMLEQWEYHLLRASRTLCPTGVIQQQLQLPNLVSCSDGSVTSQGASFGFVISTGVGRRLVKGHGMVPGSFPNSFRSESYGVLATLLWLKHAYEQCPPPQQVVIIHYLDNQSVIRRIEKVMKTARMTPNSWLLPEQDVIVEIQTILQQLPVTVKFEWVRGHQDESSAYHTLPLAAQLNCDADKEASQGALQHRGDPCILPSLSHVPCQLLIQGQSITGHLKRRVHEAHTIPRLHQYLQERFHWSVEVLTSIDWPLYEQIIKKYKDRWPTLVKHLYSISPTGKIAHRNNPLLPHECPTCLAPYETTHHVIQCPNASRAKWRQDTVLKIVSFQSDVVDPHLIDILRDGISRFHRQKEPMSPATYPSKYDLLIRQQNCIGWDQIYKGRWSREWSTLQDQYTHSHAHSYITGDDWLRRLGRILIDQWYKVWSMRNEDRHRRDNAQLREQRTQLLHDELRRLYNLRDRVCPNDRSLFYASATTHLQQQPSLDHLEDWISSFRPAIMASIEQAQKLGIHRNARITDFPAFNPITPPTEQASLAAGLPGG